MKIKAACLACFIVIIVFLVPQIAASAENEIIAESRISAVTVYPGSAKVMRTAKAELPGGSHSIVIANLPIGMNQSSLRVTGKAAQDVRLGNVEVSQEIRKEAVYEKERELTKKLEAVKQARQVVDDALSRNRQLLEYIRAMVIGKPASEKKGDEPHTNAYSSLPLEKWQEAWDTLDTATARVQEKIRMSRLKWKELDKKIRKLEAELRQVAVSRRQPSTLTARIQVEALAATNLELNISYQINGANWSPIYDADLNTQDRKLLIKTLGKVSQRTGEDWRDVKLTLSTLRPGEGAQLPDLNPWVLDFAPQPTPNSYGGFMSNQRIEESAEVSGAMMDKMDSRMLRKSMKPMAAPAPRREMLAEESQLRLADFSAEFNAPGLVSLKSGNDSKRFALVTQSFETKVQLASAPRFDPRVMILSTFKYQGESPLLAGNASLYRNGGFVGNVFLKQVLPSEEIKLSFGEDDKVKIIFQPDPDKKRKDGLLFGKRKVVERYYQVSITNQHKKPYTITLYDVFPVAADEKISVKKLGEAPDKTDIDDKKGVVAWLRTLEPGKKIKLKYGYSVSYPEDRMVDGL